MVIKVCLSTGSYLFFGANVHLLPCLFDNQTLNPLKRLRPILTVQMPKEHPVKLMIRLLLFLSFNYWGASHVDLDLVETTLHSVWLELY